MIKYSNQYAYYFVIRIVKILSEMFSTLLVVIITKKFNRFLKLILHCPIATLIINITVRQIFVF